MRPRRTSVDPGPGAESRRWRQVSVVVGALALIALATSCLREPGPPPGPQPRRIAVYGDSLLDSSAPVWRGVVDAELPEWALLERTVWGSAPCDHLEQMAADAVASWNIRVVVLEFYGNLGTACTRGHDPELLYRWDLTRAVDLWLERDVRVVLVVPPGPVDSEPGGPAARAALAVARDREVTLVDTTEDFLDPETGTFVSQLGDEVLRSPDGIHLCDHDELASTRCPEDAPGAVRFATPIADAAVAQAKLVK